jgi:hypothetical protein
MNTRKKFVFMQEPALRFGGVNAPAASGVRFVHLAIRPPLPAKMATSFDVSGLWLSWLNQITGARGWQVAEGQENMT